MRVVGISGSLRSGSLNTAALRAAITVAPPGMTIDIAEIGDLPLYNEDVRSAGFPASVQRIRDQWAGADGLLFVTPEYNYSMPGVLKNAIDWASVPPGNLFGRKPVAILGASPSALGTIRAQMSLRQSLGALGAVLFGRPEVFIANAPTKFNDQGKLTDQQTLELIAHLLKVLETVIRQVNS